MAMRQNLVPLVNIKIAGKWMFIPLKMVLIGIDPYPYNHAIYHGNTFFASSGDNRGNIMDVWGKNTRLDLMHGVWSSMPEESRKNHVGSDRSQDFTVTYLFSVARDHPHG